MKQFDLQRSRSYKSHVTKVEVKIFVVMCYYVVMGVLSFSTYGYHLATDVGPGTLRKFQKYSTCQSIGIQPDRVCGDAPDFRPQDIDVLVSVSFVLQILLPLIVLIFITNCSCSSKKQLKALSAKSKNHAASYS